MSRIFISHASANNAAALALANWLEAQGWSDYFLDVDASRGIAPGERWMAALAGAVDRCEAVIFLVSPAWRDSKFCFAEFFEAKKLGKRIFGVIVEPIALSQLPQQMTAEWQVCDLTGTLDPVPFEVALPPTLPATRLSFPRAGLEALSRGLQKAGLDASTFVWPPEGEPERSPYPGLRALDEVDAAVFFGREASIMRAIDQIRLVRERDVERLFVVLGASGAGKSSFLRAGLLPRLRRDSAHFIVLPPIRPQRAALSGSQGLLPSLQGGLRAAGLSLSPAELRAELASGGLGAVLGRIGAAAPPPVGGTAPTLVLPIDQAEELFASDGQAEARQLLDQLASLARLRVLMLLTIRSDGLPKLQAEPALQALSPVLFSLPAMPVSDFKAVIEGPAKRHSATVRPLVIDPQLTEQLVVDAQGGDALPLLALTLEWLYREFTDARGTRIGHDQYRRLGGVRGVIGMAVERAFEQPDNAPTIPADKLQQERLLQQLFPYLATVDPDSGDWKRRVALRAGLRQRLPRGDALVSRLVEQRLLSADARRLTENSEPVEVIEVVHEALLRQWDAMERWLREFAAALSAAESIRRSANDWQRSQRDEALLVHTAHRLQAAEAWLTDERLQARFEPVDADYLAACRARERKGLEEREAQLRRIAEQQAARAVLQRRGIWLLSSAALIVLGLAVWIVIQARAVSLQTSLVLTGAAEAAADQKRFDRSLRLGVLAARTGWLRQAHGSARHVVSRAADGIALRALAAGHRDGVLMASFSPDGRRLVTTSRDRLAQVWDAATGAAIGVPMALADDAVDARFSDDGTQVVTSTRRQVSRLWEAATGKALGEAAQADRSSYSRDGKRVLRLDGKQVIVTDTGSNADLEPPIAHAGLVREANWNAAGTRIVTASEDTTARVWDAATGQAVGEPMRHRAGVDATSFSADGRRVVTLSGTEVRVWDAASGLPVGVPLTHAQPVAAARLSDDGRHLVIASGPAARVWDVDSGRPLGDPMLHEQTVNFAAFSADGQSVVTASDDTTAGIWTVGTGRLLAQQQAHRGSVSTPRFAPDGTRFVTTSEDGTARLWDAASGRPVGAPMAHGQGVGIARFSADGRRLLTVSGHDLRLWQADSGTPAGAPLRHDQTITFAEFSPDGAHVVTVTDDKATRVWSLATGQPLGPPMVPDSPWQLDPSPNLDGSLLATAALDGPAVIWDSRAGRFVGLGMRHENYIQSVELSADGRRLLTRDGDNLARVWDVATRQLIGQPIRHGKWLNAASFSPDGRWVVTASGNATARVWDADTGQPVGDAMGHGDLVQTARFSADGRRVVTGSADQTARVWDAATGKPLGEPMPHPGRFVSVGFSADGLRVVTESGDATARVWDAFWPALAGSASLLDTVCQRLLRGPLRRITEADVRAARILSRDRIGEDVCAGVATPP